MPLPKSISCAFSQRWTPRGNAVRIESVPADPLIAAARPRERPPDDVWRTRVVLIVFLGVELTRHHPLPPTCDPDAKQERQRERPQRRFQGVFPQLLGGTRYDGVHVRWFCRARPRSGRSPVTALAIRQAGGFRHCRRFLQIHALLPRLRNSNLPPDCSVPNRTSAPTGNRIFVVIIKLSR